MVVVENGSKMFEALSGLHRIKYFHLDRASIPAARNVGLFAAEGQYVLFSDADCLATENWIQEMVRYLEDHAEISGCGGPIDRYQPASPVQRYSSNLANSQRSLNYLPIMSLPYVVTANCAFRKGVLVEVGGFDEELLSGADVDICYKLGIHGHQIGICPDALVYHDNRSTVRSHFIRFFRYATYQALLFKKYQNVIGARFRFNPYPYQCFRRGVGGLVDAAVSLARGNTGPLWSSFLVAVEGLGVLLGNVYGALRFRVFYF